MFLHNIIKNLTKRSINIRHIHINYLPEYQYTTTFIEKVNKMDKNYLTEYQCTTTFIEKVNKMDYCVIALVEESDKLIKYDINKKTNESYCCVIST